MCCSPFKPISGGLHNRPLTSLPQLLTSYVCLYVRPFSVTHAKGFGPVIIIIRKVEKSLQMYTSKCSLSKLTLFLKSVVEVNQVHLNLISLFPFLDCVNAFDKVKCIRA